MFESKIVGGNVPKEYIPGVEKGLEQIKETGVLAGYPMIDFKATLIDGANTGQLLAAQGNGSAPSFVNTTNSAFSFASGTLTINNAAITTGTITGVPTNGTDIVNKT